MFLDVEIQAPAGSQRRGGIPSPVCSRGRGTDGRDGRPWPGGLCDGGLPQRRCAGGLECSGPHGGDHPRQAVLLTWFTTFGALNPSVAVLQAPFTCQGIPAATTDTGVPGPRREGQEVWRGCERDRRRGNPRVHTELLALGADGVISGRPAEAAASESDRVANIHQARGVTKHFQYSSPNR